MTTSKSSKLLLLATLCIAPIRVWSLWPIPTKLQTGTTGLTLSPSFSFDVAIPNPPIDLLQAVTETRYYLDNDKLGRLVVGRGANDNSIIAGAKSLRCLKLSLTEGVEVQSISYESVKSLETRKEEYTLTIPEDGSEATLTANSTLGLYRGLTTFSQLWYYYNGVTYTTDAPIKITDAPAYVSIFAETPRLQLTLKRSPIVAWDSTQLGTCTSEWLCSVRSNNLCS